MTFRKTLTAAASALLLSLGAAQADEGFSSADLDAFVTALTQVNELHMSYTERLQAAADEEAQARIIEEGNAAIVSAIDAVEGMDVDLYASIIDEAGTDPGLNDRITRRLEGQTGG